MDRQSEFQARLLEARKAEEAEELSENADIIDAFKKFMASKGITLKDADFSYFYTVGIVATYPNIIDHLADCIVKDKDGLIDFHSLCTNLDRKMFANGYLYGPNFVLMAHPHFRRGHDPLNNFAPCFIDHFWSKEYKGATKLIALDCDRVRINVDSSALIEKDTWYGAKFNEVIGKIPDGITKLAPPYDIDDLVSMFFAEVHSLDIKWSTKGSIKTFQAEEFKNENVTIDIDGQSVHPARYIHAEFDLGTNTFRHFDGAIHYYLHDEYLARKESDLNYNSKTSSQIKAKSQKLFRMDGVIDVQTWIELTSHFFTQDPLVFEYFEGKFPDHIAEILEAIQKSKESKG